MTVIGFHCSHEQISPAQPLRDIQHAEPAGFTAAPGSGEASNVRVRSQLSPTAPASTPVMA